MPDIAFADVEPQQLSQLQNNNESEYDQHEENVDCVTTLASHNQQKSGELKGNFLYNLPSNVFNLNP